jgi:hypothetical protein
MYSTIMLNAVLQCVIMLNAILLSVIMLNVVAPMIWFVRPKSDITVNKSARERPCTLYILVTTSLV